MKRRLSGSLLLLAGTTLLFGLSSTILHAQYADRQAVEILERAQRAYERSIEGIDDYVMITDSYTTYYVKEYDNGRPYFRTHTEIDEWGDIESTSTASDADLFAPDVFEKFKQSARYEGRDRVDGYEVHVLFMDEVEGILDEDIEDIDEVLEQVRIYIDVDDLVMRKMSYRVEAKMDDGDHRIIEPEILFRDYRSVEGMMVPFETVTVITGLSEMMTDEERQEAEEALREMERELEQMPEGQRQMVERMMGERLKEFREMLSADRMEFTVTVQEVKVNTGGDW